MKTKLVHDVGINESESKLISDLLIIVIFTT